MTQHNSPARKAARLEAIKAQGHTDSQIACQEVLEYKTEPSWDWGGNCTTPEITEELLEECAKSPTDGWDGWLISSGCFSEVAGCDWSSDIPWAVEAAKTYHQGGIEGAKEWLKEQLRELEACTI